MRTVSGSTFAKQFGRYRIVAHREPVSVTSHGNEDLVLLSADEFKRLKLRDQTPLFAWELTSEHIAALNHDDIPEETAEFNRELEG